MQWHKIWEDQAEFNRLVRPDPKTKEERNDLLRYFILCGHSELDELLRAVEWRQHRKVPVIENLSSIREELIDLFKYWVSMCLLFDFQPEDVQREYWRKSAVVRQRFSEEYVKTVERPSVVIDIDDVICDFTGGFVDWLMREGLRHPCQTQLPDNPNWFSAHALGFTESEWHAIKRRFYLSGLIGAFKPMPGAVDFLRQVRVTGLNIIMLTSRNLEKYPNMMTDTVAWLNENGIPYDFIWWSKNKRERLIDSPVSSQIRFAVDDHEEFVKQFDSLGIETYWYRIKKDWNLTALEAMKHVTPISSLSEIKL